MQKENKLGVMPINKLVLTMSLPIIFSMLVQALYNIVDGVFVAQLSENAFTAVSLAFPMQNLLIAIGTGTGVGVNALLSRSLGEKDFKKVNNIATHGVFLVFASAIVIMLFGFFGVNAYFSAQIDYAQNPEIFNYGVEYLEICSIFSFAVFGQIMFERLAQATGKSMLSMITQLSGAIINIILDPLLINGYGPFPRLEVSGAAIATVIGQSIAFTIGIILNHYFNKEIKIQFKGFRPNARLIFDVYKIGVPSIIMVAIGSVMTFLMNKILLVFSTTAASVFGAYFKIQSFFFMPVYGLNNATIPIIAYNYGAKNKKRMNDTIRFASLVAIGIMAVGTTVMMLIPSTLLGLFKASDHMIEIGVPALRIICTVFVCAAYCIVISGAFQALGKSSYSMVVSFIRQLVVLIPAAYFLSLTGKIELVWLSFPIAEIGSLLASAFFHLKIKRGIIDKIEAEN